MDYWHLSKPTLPAPYSLYVQIAAKGTKVKLLEFVVLLTNRLIWILFACILFHSLFYRNKQKTEREREKSKGEKIGLTFARHQQFSLTSYNSRGVVGVAFFCCSERYSCWIICFFNFVALTIRLWFKNFFVSVAEIAVHPLRFYRRYYIYFRFSSNSRRTHKKSVF